LFRLREQSAPRSYSAARKRPYCVRNATTAGTNASTIIGSTAAAIIASSTTVWGNDPPFNFLRVATWVDFSHVTKILDAPDEFQRLLAVQTRLTGVEPGQLEICPYRGLDALREEDSGFFFGRGSAKHPESPLGQLTRKVREHPFVMVVGRSGSGSNEHVAQ
jgi:Novel STAND NTPase 1